MAKLSLLVASPPHRDQCTVELWDDDSFNLAEVWNEGGTNFIELYDRHDPNSPQTPPFWQFELDHLIEMLQEARASIALNGPGRY